MKIKSLIIGMVCMAVILPVSVFSAPPQLPHIFFGTVTNNGDDLPVDTVIIAKVDGVEKGRVTVSVAGEYGGPNALDGKLLVQGGLAITDVVKFYIGNNVATQKVFFSSGIVRELDLAFAFAEVTVGSGDLGALISGGTFSVSGSNTSASSVKAVQQVLINVGSNMVSLPQGTVITKIGGGNFDATALTTTETAVGSLSGLGTGVVAKGALQWGISSLGLQFNPAITISIYVGTSLNGQTLDVMRSVTGSSDWTSDGIVSPATCVVSGGYCSFSATKASYYVVSDTPAAASSGSSGGSGGSGGYYALTLPAAETYAIGDINGSGKVDKYDFALMMSVWGKTGTGLAADLNKDGKVDKYDFALLMLNWSIS